MRDRLGPAGGDLGLHPERRELARDQLGDLALVVDDQHAPAADRVERAALELGPPPAAAP